MTKKIFVVLLGIIIFSMYCVYGVEYSIEKYDIEAELLDNGDLHITEYIKYSVF